MKITVKPLRDEALKAGFASILDRLPHGYSFEEFRGKVADFEVKAFCDDERVVGMLMTRGPELHVAVIPEVRGKWLSRRLIREVFSPIFQQYGEAVTGVMPDNEEGKEFTRRLGFAGDVAFMRLGIESKRFDPVTAAIGIGGSLLGGAISGSAAKSAASQQASAANNATNTQLQMFNTQNLQQLPYRQAGYNALNALNYGTSSPSQASAKPSFMWEGNDYGTPDQFLQSNIQNYRNITGKEPNADVIATLNNDISQAMASGASSPGTGNINASNAPFDAGYFTHQFNANDLNANLAPNYAFQLQQGQGAAKNALNLTGGIGGNFGKGLVDYTINKAGDAYQQAFNNYTTNQSNIFNRLSNIAGLGQTANAATSALAGQTAQGVANTQVGAGTAQAAGTVGQANAVTGGLNNALGWYTLSNLNSPAGGGTPYSTLAATPFNNSANYG